MAFGSLLGPAPTSGGLMGTSSWQTDPELLNRLQQAMNTQGRPMGALEQLRAAFADPEKRAALMGFGQNMLAASGWSDRPVTLGQAVASGMQGAQTAQAAFQQRIAAQQKDVADQARAALEARKTEAEIGKLGAETADMAAPKLREVNLGGQRLLVNERDPFGADGQISGYRLDVTLDPAEAARLEAERIRAAQADAQREADRARQGFGDATNLRKEAQTAIKPYKESIDYADRLTETLNNYQPGISTVAAVKLFNLMLEPSSVVREDDFNQAAGSSGAFGSFTAMLKSLSEGKDLPAATRQQMANYARLYRSIAERKAADIATGYRSTARAGGIDEGLLLLDGFAPSSAPAGNPNDPSKW